AHLVRFDVLPPEDLAQRPLRQLRKAGVPRRRAVLANVPGEQPRRPQFVGIAEVLGFAAGKVDNEGPRLVGDDRFASRPRAVVERRHDAEPFGPPQTPLDRLVRHPDRASNRNRTAFPGRRAASAPARPGSPAPPVTGRAAPIPPSRRPKSPTRPPAW